MANTPTSKVEALFNKYQTLDKDIKSGIEDILNEQINTYEDVEYVEVEVVYEVKENIETKEKIVF